MHPVLTPVLTVILRYLKLVRFVGLFGAAFFLLMAALQRQQIPEQLKEAATCLGMAVLIFAVEKILQRFLRK